MSSSLGVVLFSGGRGSGGLTRQLLNHPQVQLTLAINGYDDGASTGEVRRFLGDSLGPSDFRKNASRLASELGTCVPALIEMLDTRLPEAIAPDAALREVRRQCAPYADALQRVEAFAGEVVAGAEAGRGFRFGDCAIGNIVFAGCFLTCHRDFNAAVDDYCGLLGLPAAMIENVTDGTDAHLVAVSADGTILGSEEEIVGAAGKNRIRDIYLIDHRLDDSERRQLAVAGPDAAARFFSEHAATVRLNPRLVDRIKAADLIIYAPGTQHSSLFPSYLTPGLSEAIAGNLRAIKLLITNIQTDAEIAGSSAVDIIDRALYYLTDRGRRARPTPCLITHYLVNDPGQLEASTPYVPLGQIETLEDPRLVRVANFEDGISGRHDAAKILGPFVRSLVEQRARQHVAVLLYDAGSSNKITQTLLEMVRGGIAAQPLDVTVFYQGPSLDEEFVASLPFSVRALVKGAAFRDLVQADACDYVMLFESSGMYRGEDIAALAGHLASGRLDAVWGSRRLSVRDIEESIRFRYQRSPLAGMMSKAGSHVLSLACLVFYGRYISDTLSAVRAVRSDDALALDVAFDHPQVNQYILRRLLRRKADILEIPVQFFPISPERVKRTSVGDGLRALTTLIAGRFAPIPASHTAAAAVLPDGDKRSTTPVASR